MTRDQKRIKLMKQIKDRVKELFNMGFVLSDRDSVICLFDDEMFPGKSFDDLTEEEQSKTVVDHL